MCPRLLCGHSPGPRCRAVMFYVAVWLGWLLGGFELGLTMATDEPYLKFLNTPDGQRPILLAALLAVHPAAAGLCGLIAGRWADSVVETRALVIMSAVPQLLGAALYFFAGTLGELVLARVLTGVGTGASVAMLCELLRMAPLRFRVAALAGLAISREVGVDIGPTVASRLGSFPDLPADVLRHRVTPWNAPGLLLLVCHLVYLLLLIGLYPNLTLERETEMMELRRLLFPEGLEELDHADVALPQQNDEEQALEDLRIFAEQYEREQGVPIGEEQPVVIPRPPVTPSPSPAPPRTASQLAAIGHAFANPGTPQPLPPPKSTFHVFRMPRPPQPPPPPPADPERGLLGAEAAPAESGDETDAPSVEAELQFPMSSRSPTSDEEKNPLKELQSEPDTVNPEEPAAHAEESADPSLRGRRWPGSPDLTIATSSGPLTPVEKTAWFTPAETPSAVKLMQDVPPAAESLQGEADAANPTRPAAEAPQTTASAAEPSQTAPPVAEPSQTAPPDGEPVQRSPSAAESIQGAPSAVDSVQKAPSDAESSQMAPPAVESMEKAPSAAVSVQRAPCTAEPVPRAPSAAESVQRAPSAVECVQKALSDVDLLQEALRAAGILPRPRSAPESRQRPITAAGSSLRARSATAPPRIAIPAVLTTQGGRESPMPDQGTTSSGVPSQEGATAAGPPVETLPAPGPSQAAPDASRPAPLSASSGPDPALEQPSPDRPHLDAPQPQAGDRQRPADQVDRPRHPTNRPLEGPYAHALEAAPEELLARIRFWADEGDDEYAAAARRIIRRMMRSWERVLCGPTVTLLVSCLVAYVAMSALNALMPHENDLGHMELTPRWMMGASATMRLFTFTGLLATLAWEEGLGEKLVAFAMAAMAAAHLCLALSLMTLHGYTSNWSSPKPSSEEQLPGKLLSDGEFAWAWVLRVGICVQKVAEALFEPAALALFSHLVSRTAMGRGVSVWMLAMRAGVLIGPFWTVGLIGNPLFQFLTPMAEMTGCAIALVLLHYCYRFGMRQMHVSVLDRVGPRLPIVGLRGRTMSFINHVRQFYCAEADDAVAADGEGGAAVAPRDGAVVAPADGDRGPLLAAEGGR